MSRVATIFLILIAAGLVAAVLSTRSCSPDSAGDRLVFNMEPRSIQSIRVTNGSDTFELKRRAQGWQILAKERKDRADSARVDELLSEAIALTYHDKISSSEISGKDELADYGLKSSKRAIELEGSSKKKLILGSEAALPGRIYARFDGARDIYLIPDRIAALLPVDKDDFRDRQLSDLPTDQVDRILIRNDLGEIELQRSPLGWQLVKPLRAKADDTTIEKYLASLLGAPIRAFVDDDTGDLGAHGIVEGRSEVAFYVEGRDRPLVLRFGNSQESPAASVLAQFTGRDAVVSLPAVSRGLIDVTPSRFRDKRLLPLNIDHIDRVRIRSADTRIELNRKDDGWIVSSEPGSPPADPAAIIRLFDTLTTVEAIEFVSKSPDGRPPAWAAEFLAVLSENTPEAIAGESVVATLALSTPSGGRSIATLRGASDDAIVDATLFDSLPTQPADITTPEKK